MNIYVKIVIYIIPTIKYSKKILESNKLNSSQKIINSIMIWLIPYLWYWLIKGLLQPTETMTKNKLKIDKSNYYESGIGKTLCDMLQS